MPVGTEKNALLGAAGQGGLANWFGDNSLGTCVFGTGSVSQSGHSTSIDSVLTTGAAASGGGSNPNGHGVPNGSDVYGFSVTSGGTSITSPRSPGTQTTYNANGDMVLLNFTDLTVDASCTLTTQHPCRGLFIYVNGNAVINGSISMTARGGRSDPTAGGGSDGNAVQANGIQLGLVTPSGSSSFTNDGTGFNGCGNAIRTAIGDNQEDIASNGTIFTVARTGGAGGASAQCQGSSNAGAAGQTGGITLSSGGGASGGVSHNNEVYGCPAHSGAGGTGGAFSGGAGGGGCHNNNTQENTYGTAGGNYGGLGGRGRGAGGNPAASGGTGNPGGGIQTGGTYEYGADGVGGLIWLVVSGNISGSGNIQCNGYEGGTWGSSTSGAGGGSGGGCAFALYGGSMSGVSMSATGATTPGWPSTVQTSGAGGTHSMQISV